MSAPATDAARAVWFLGLLAKRMQRQSDRTAELALPARYADALAAYHPYGDAAVYGRPCPICGGTDDTIPPGAEDVLDANQSGEPIDTPSRADTIASGQLVDVNPSMAEEAGFRPPVALTRAAWRQAVEWSDDGTTAEETGRRLWEVLTLARRAAWWAGGVNGVAFSMPVMSSGGRTAEMVSLTLDRRPGDDGEPVLTIMLSDEAGS